MKPFFVLLAVFLFIYQTYAQAGIDSIFVQTYTDSVCIWNTNIPATCGASFTTSISIVNDSIYILESDTSTEHFRCPCSFDVNVTLFGLAIGNYSVYIFRSNWSPQDTFFIGTINFTIQKSSSLPFSFYSFSSSCHEIMTNINEGKEIPNTFSLLGNYPNPFNPVTIIRYQIHQRSKVKLEIFDELGRITATLVCEEKSIGDYEIPWDASGFSSGIYFYKLTAGNEIQIRKMTLLK